MTCSTSCQLQFSSGSLGSLVLTSQEPTLGHSCTCSAIIPTTRAWGQAGPGGDSSESQCRLTCIFLMRCFQTLCRPIVASLPCDHHCQVTASSTAPLPKGSCADAPLPTQLCSSQPVKTRMNLTSSFILLLINAAATAPPAQLPWSNCIDMKLLYWYSSVHWSEGLSACDWQCTSKNMWALKHLLSAALSLCLLSCSPDMAVQWLKYSYLKRNDINKSYFRELLTVHHWSQVLQCVTLFCKRTAPLTKMLKPFLVYTVSKLLLPVHVLQSHLIVFKFTNSLSSDNTPSDTYTTPKKEIGLARWHRRHNSWVTDLHSAGPERNCTITDNVWTRKKI